MCGNEISKLIEGLRTARHLADQEQVADMLVFLINRAMEEAVAEAKRLDGPIPEAATTSLH